MKNISQGTSLTVTDDVWTHFGYKKRSWKLSPLLPLVVSFRVLIINYRQSLHSLICSEKKTFSSEGMLFT